MIFGALKKDIMIFVKTVFLVTFVVMPFELTTFNITI
jgi:hypothetical protein